jgi:nicotinate-nucleotide pyrophosphorylase (carboxylating)
MPLTRQKFNTDKNDDTDQDRRVRAILEGALVEDTAAQDVTTALTIDPKLRASGTILAKQPCTIAGLGAIPVILEIFSELHGKIDGARPLGRYEVIHHPEIFDGVKVKKGQQIAVIRYNAGAILSCERTILNLLQRMSGIATLTNEFVKAVAGTKTKILDTRKTIPGLRALDKYAVCCGGGVNHRLDLRDGILIKNNHISLGGGVTAALAKALAGRSGKQVVQVEVRDQKELDEAIMGGAESILLDNMTPAAAKKAVKQIRAALPGVPIEASGNMSLKTVREYAVAGVDFCSVGALTHSAVAVDLSMRIAADGS